MGINAFGWMYCAQYFAGSGFVSPEAPVSSFWFLYRFELKPRMETQA